MDSDCLPHQIRPIAGIPIRRPPPKPRWSLDRSIWKPRAPWCDSQEFWDTDMARVKRFHLDWARLLALGVPKMTLRLAAQALKGSSAKSNPQTADVDVLVDAPDGKGKPSDPKGKEAAAAAEAEVVEAASQAELQKMKDVLWTFSSLLHNVFSFYAATGGDPLYIQLNEWTQFLTDYNLVQLMATDGLRWSQMVSDGL